MYKLYSVHVNDLSVWPRFLVPFSSSACPQLWSGDFLSPGGSATSWCSEAPGRRPGAAFSFSSCTEMLRVPTCLSFPSCPLFLSEHAAPPRL